MPLAAAGKARVEDDPKVRKPACVLVIHFFFE